MDNNDERVEESTLYLAYTSLELPTASLTALAREHYILADVAANMRSGFILLNRGEHVTYSNPRAQRLLGISGRELLNQPGPGACCSTLAACAILSRARPSRKSVGTGCAAG